MKRVFPLLIALALAVITLGALASLPADVWTDWRPATCLTRGCFCEAPNGGSPIRQMANTISSLGYIFSGMTALTLSKRARRFSFGHAAIFGASSMAIGAGSAFYHASLTFAGQFFDVLGMFMLAAFMLTYAFERLWNLRFATTLGMFLAAIFFLSALQIVLPDTRRFAFAVILLVALLFEAYYHRRKAPIIAVDKLRLGLVLLTVAYGVWTLDTARIFCLETSLAQGHAVWHILGAASVWLMAQYYASEKTDPTPAPMRSA